MGSIAAQGQLPLFTLPEVRRDCEMRLAALFRDICYNDARPEGCIAGNEFLASQCGVSRGHVPALLARLEACNLVVIEITRGNVRKVTPLVDLATVMRCGWKALCVAILARDKFPRPLRALAKWLLDREHSGKPDLVKLGIEQCREVLNAARSSAKRSSPNPQTPVSGKKSEGTLKGTLKGFPIKERSEETTTSTEASKIPTSPQSAQPAAQSAPDPAAVLLLTQKAAIPEPEARSLAATLTKMGGTVGNISHAVQVMLGKSGVTNRGGFLVSAIRAAVAGNPYLLPTPGAAHPSDRGERPQRLYSAPRTATKAPEAPAAPTAWEKLSAEAQEGLKHRAMEQLATEEMLPMIRTAIERAGITHPHVLTRAKKLAEQVGAA